MRQRGIRGKKRQRLTSHTGSDHFQSSRLLAVCSRSTNPFKIRQFAICGPYRKPWWEILFCGQSWKALNCSPDKARREFIICGMSCFSDPTLFSLHLLLFSRSIYAKWQQLNPLMAFCQTRITMVMNLLNEHYTSITIIMRYNLVLCPCAMHRILYLFVLWRNILTKM